MLTRSIDRVDPFDLTFEQKFFRGAKRVCVGFSAIALSLGVLDLLDIRSAEQAAHFWQTTQPRIAAMAATIKGGIREIDIMPRAPSVVVMIPKSDIVLAQKSLPPAQPAMPEKPATPAQPYVDLSPADELAVARDRDAITVAMVSPPVKLMAAGPAVAPAGRNAKAGALKLAAVTTDQMPAPIMASLPMSQPELELNPPAEPIPPELVPLPQPAPGAPPPSPAQRLKLEGEARAKAESCLAKAVYFEARSEPVRGQIAVAQVVINRVFSPFYPNDVCSVVYQNAHRRLSCQFTFACDGKPESITEPGPWWRAKRIARQALDGALFEPEVAKSTHYHAVYVHPNWVGEMRRMVRYGVHAFYRPRAWGNGHNEPVWSRGEMEARKISASR